MRVWGTHAESRDSLQAPSLRGRRLKGKGKAVLGKGVLGARETRGARVVSRPNSIPQAPEIKTYHRLSQKPKPSHDQC